MNIDTMSHEQAVRGQAVERYVLGELTPEERDAFEGHYFDCSNCFEQVKLNAQFLHHAREVLDPEPEKGWLARMLGDLRRPVPAFVTAVLACVIGIGIFQQFRIADLKAPRIESHYPLVGDARGAAKPVSVSRKAGLSLTLEFAPKPEFSSYQVQIVSGSGQVRASLPVVVAPGQDSVTISLRANTLEPGRYSMVVYGLAQNRSKTEVARGEFDLQLMD